MRARNRLNHVRRRLIAGGLGALLLLAVPLAGSATAQDNNAIGEDTALLIIDIQAFYFPGGALPLTEPEPAAANAGRLLERFRQEGRLVVHVGHKVTQGGEFHTMVMPSEGEKVYHKTEVSAFNGTDLADFLRGKGITKLVIVGMQTHMCLEGAVRAAYDLGFEVTVAHDACATRDLKFGEAEVAAADIHASTLATLNGAYARVVTTESLLVQE